MQECLNLIMAFLIKKKSKREKFNYFCRKFIGPRKVQLKFKFIFLKFFLLNMPKDLVKFFFQTFLNRRSL